jgi:type II secretory pathway pseudopilin PulG
MKRNDTSRALSVVEVLIVLTVLALVAALLYPIVVRARDRAKEATCYGNLRNIQTAVALYRADYDGESKYGAPEAMGLPPSIARLMDYGAITKTTMQCPGRPFSPGLRQAVYTQYWPPFGRFAPSDSFLERMRAEWLEAVQRMREDTVIVGDLNHDFPGRDVHEGSVEHRAIGVTLGGQVDTAIRTGSPLNVRWWVVSTNE